LSEAKVLREPADSRAHPEHDGHSDGKDNSGGSDQNEKTEFSDNILHPTSRFDVELKPYLHVQARPFVLEYFYCVFVGTVIRISFFLNSLILY
jgi:hypothetical protein